MQYPQKQRPMQKPIQKPLIPQSAPVVEEEQEVETTSKLVEKVKDLLIRFEELKIQNSTLRQELVTVKAQSELKDGQIEKLEEDLINRDIESEELFGRIEEVLKR